MPCVLRRSRGRNPVDKVSQHIPIYTQNHVYYKGGRDTHISPLFLFTYMRKIEAKMCEAIRNRKDWCQANTQVSYNDLTKCAQIYLHGHQIATVDHNTNAVKLSSCGYTTNTTKSRLNALLNEVKYGCRVFQKNWEWFVSYNNQTQDFVDGMILIDANHLEVA